jgi:hypothetical protein
MNDSGAHSGADAVQIPGYDFGRAQAARSPLSLEELRQLERTIGWTAADAAVLLRHRKIFEDQASCMVDAWRAVIGAQPHLAQAFFGPDGRRDEDYAARVKARFVQWVVDACVRPHDHTWLDYQEEIGLRHTPRKKNKTDGKHTPAVVPMRYLVAFVVTITRESRPFFLGAGVTGDELRELEDAWAKTVQLHVTLWTRPYAQEGLW